MIRHRIRKYRDPRTGRWWAEAWLEAGVLSWRVSFWRRRVPIAPSPYD